MSREVVFVAGTSDFEVEDAVSARELVDVLDATLLPYLEAERERLVAESTFLKEVYEGITQGAPLEATSTLYVDDFLDSVLLQLG